MSLAVRKPCFMRLPFDTVRVHSPGGQVVWQRLVLWWRLCVDPHRGPCWMSAFGAKDFKIVPRPAFFRLVFFSRTSGRCKPAFMTLVFPGVSLVACFRAAYRRNDTMLWETER